MTTSDALDQLVLPDKDAAPFQQGGVFVFSSGGAALYAHASTHAGDHPDEDEVLAVLEGSRTTA